MSPRRTAIAVLAAAPLALGGAGAAGGTALPPALASVLEEGKIVRAEVVVLNGGAVHDYRIDRGRIVGASGGALVLAERDGTTQTVPVDPGALVTLNGRPAQLARLRAGIEATTVRDGDAGAAWIVASGRAKR